MAIGYAAMVWADAARSIPGAEDHELFPAVVAWASWGKVMRGDYQHGEDLADEARAAQQRLGTEHLWVHMASATVAFFTGDLDRAREHAEEWVRLARPTGDLYELANALVMLASTVQLADRNAALANAEEAVQVARNGGIYSALSIGLSLLAGLIIDDDIDRATVIFEEAIEVARLVGDRSAISQAPLMRSWLAARRGEWHAALRCAHDAAEQKLALGDVALIPVTAAQASIALAQLRALEPSAVLYGAKDGAPFWPDAYLQEFARTEAALVNGLGADRFSTLRAHGASMSHTDVVTYLRSATARVLDEA